MLIAIFLIGEVHEGWRLEVEKVGLIIRWEEVQQFRNIKITAKSKKGGAVEYSPIVSKEIEEVAGQTIDEQYRYRYRLALALAYLVPLC